jgi:hypothetical protein
MINTFKPNFVTICSLTLVLAASGFRAVSAATIPSTAKLSAVHESVGVVYAIDGVPMPFAIHVPLGDQPLGGEALSMRCQSPNGVIACLFFNPAKAKQWRAYLSAARVSPILVGGSLVARPRDSHFVTLGPKAWAYASQWNCGSKVVTCTVQLEPYVPAPPAMAKVMGYQNSLTSLAFPAHKMRRGDPIVVLWISVPD